MAEHDSSKPVHFNTKHGFARTSEYKIWERMISRCHNPADWNFPRYGQCGICVCQRWRDSFIDFLADMGKRPSNGHSLDRYPNQDGNYEPGNVRWATDVEQARNQRSNHLLTHNGETLTIAAWAERLGFNAWTIQNRLKYGWSVARALTAPADARERTLTFNGETLTISEWSARLGFSRTVIGNRLRSGWSIERALTTPARQFS